MRIGPALPPALSSGACTIKYREMLLSVQIVHFIRHGEGYHNVAGRKSTEEYKKEDYADAHLTELGWTQVFQHSMMNQTPHPCSS